MTPVANDRLLFLGGTFDPLHHGHLDICRYAVHQLQTQACHLLPCGYPADKQHASQGHHRLAMLQACLSVLADKAVAESLSLPKLRLETYEMTADRPVQTIDTVMALRARHPHAVLYFVCGRDTYNGMPGWQGFERIIDYVNIAVIDRDCGDDGYWRKDSRSPLRNLVDADLEQLCGQVIRLEGQVRGVSSTDIRSWIQSDPERCRLHLPAVVYDYIVCHGLYGLE